MSVYGHTNLHEMPIFRVGGRCVGRGQPSLVIAEAGVNHDGCVGKAIEMIEAAARTGVDAVKFQVFRAATLTTPDAPTAQYQREGCGYQSQYDMLAQLELSDDDLRVLSDRCKSLGLLFLATPFSVDDVARVVSSGASAIKIASTDLTNHALLDEAAQTGLPMIVSTGASTESEICASAAHLLSKVSAEKLALLHCVSCYPTPLDQINLRAIETLSDTFGVVSGLSDHTMSVDTGAWSVAVGASILEKHFTTTPTAAGPDHAMSLPPADLKRYVDQIRQLERSLGQSKLGLSTIEADVRQVAGKSIVAIANIEAGMVLTKAMLSTKRPGTGIAGGHLSELVGRRACVPIACDSILAWNMVE